MQMRTATVFALVIAAYGLAAGAQPPPKFMGGPVTLEDQGSFFVGGVTKITRVRGGAVRAAGPAAAARPTPQQITIGQMYVQFQIPARAIGTRLARHHGARLHAHRRRARVHA